VEIVVIKLLATNVWNYVPPKNGEIALLLATNGGQQDVLTFDVLTFALQ